MNTISTQDLDRRGIAALKEALKKGPVHIVDDSGPVCVVLTEEAYNLRFKTTQGSETEHPQPEGESLFERMLKKPATGTKTREELDARLSALRDEWD